MGVFDEWRRRLQQCIDTEVYFFFSGNFDRFGPRICSPRARLEKVDSVNSRIVLIVRVSILGRSPGIVLTSCRKVARRFASSCRPGSSLRTLRRRRSRSRMEPSSWNVARSIPTALNRDGAVTSSSTPNASGFSTDALSSPLQALTGDSDASLRREMTPKSSLPRRGVPTNISSASALSRMSHLSRSLSNTFSTLF
jgi:hypothetical protein